MTSELDCTTLSEPPPPSVAAVAAPSSDLTVGLVPPHMPAVSVPATSGLVITPPEDDVEDEEMKGDGRGQCSEGVSDNMDECRPSEASLQESPAESLSVPSPEPAPALQPIVSSPVPEEVAPVSTMSSPAPVAPPSQQTVPSRQPVAAPPHRVVLNEKPVARPTLVVQGPDDQSSPVQDKKSKKSLRKEKIAAADSSREGGQSMLDAYTTTSKQNPQETTPVPVAPAPVAPNSPTMAEPEPEDDWETQALKIAEEDVKEVKPEPIVRSLRPGGGGAAAKLGTNAKPTPKSVTYQYRKADLLRLRVPREQLQRPPGFFETIVVLGLDNQPIARGAYGGKSPLQQQHQQQLLQYYGGPLVIDSSRARAAPLYPSGQHMQPPGLGPGLGVPGDEGKPSWKRGQQGRRGRPPAPPMPRKVITDPMEAMSREVIAILNKITPQTFLKLTRKLADVEVSNSTMLEKLIQLVVDKAISEPTFSHLYAEMVSILDTENKYMNFFHVVWNKDSQQYFWVRDLQCSGNLVGPFQSPSECVDVSQAQILPMAVPVSFPVLTELVVVNGVLVNVRMVKL